MFRYRLLLTGFALLTASGCTTGYTEIDGEWCFVVINEAVGREVRKMDADKATFEILDVEGYARDKNHVYRSGLVVEGLDGATFEFVSGEQYYKDKDAVYLYGKTIPDADPATFKIISTPYCRDAASVYCGNLKMNVEHPQNFTTRPGHDAVKDTRLKYYFKKQDLVADLGQEFQNVAVDHDHPVIVSRGLGTDGEWNYDGAQRTERVEPE